MKILVISDTHGNFENIIKVIKENEKCEYILHLGDICGNLDEIRNLYKDKKIIAVRGNMDFDSQEDIFKVLNLKNNKIFMTHGHIYDVKNRIDQLKKAALEHQARIILFGHTHKPLILKDDNFYIINPGSLRGKQPSYAIITLEKDEIQSELSHL